MSILVDSSVWIDYFRDGKYSNQLDYYIEQNIISTNDLILAELIPVLKLKRKFPVVSLLRNITIIPLVINWENIINYQTTCLKHGINKVGIPDLIILDNVIQNDLTLFSLDKHFKLINNHIGFELL